MTRLVFSLFAVVCAVGFGACQQHSVAELPPHYQHKMHHGDTHAEKQTETKTETTDPAKPH